MEGGGREGGREADKKETWRKEVCITAWWLGSK
jgi:hypothetical protein